VESQALVHSLGVRRETHVCPDPAYALDMRDYLTSEPPTALTSARSRALLATLRPAIGTQLSPDAARVSYLRRGAAAVISKELRPKVGLNPAGYCDPRLWPRAQEDTYSRYLDRLTSFSKWLLEQNYDIELFTSDIGVDGYAIEDLNARLLAGVSPELASRVFLRPVVTLTELLVQMSTFDFVVTSKFHGVIFSHLLGKPVIATSYSLKIDQLMQTAGHGQYCLPIEQCDVDWLVERFQSLVREKDQLTQLFRKISTGRVAALRTHFDALFPPAIPSPIHEAYCGTVPAAQSLIRGWTHDSDGCARQIGRSDKVKAGPLAPVSSSEGSNWNL